MRDYVPQQFSPKTWLPHRNALLGMISLVLAGLALVIFGTLPLLRVPAAGVVVVAMFAFAQFTYSAVKMPYPMDETIAVKLYERAKWRWERFSRPLRVTIFNGQPVYVRDHDYLDYRELYDRDGYLIQSEQTINWSDIDLEWQPGMPEDIETITKPASKHKRPERISWLSLMRSPALPADIVV